MKNYDYSKEIFEKYYNSKNRLLEITLQDNTVLEGILISFIQGDESSGEPYIIKWHFLDKTEISKQNNLISIDGSEEYGKPLLQKDIKSVKFKV